MAKARSKDNTAKAVAALEAAAEVRAKKKASSEKKSAQNKSGKKNPRVLPQVKKPPPFPWLGELFTETGRVESRSFFGGRAYYLNGKNVAFLTESEEEPWNGYLLPTSREHHASLLQQWPVLVEHPFLGKWLYLSQSHPDFEGVSEELVRAALKGDPRIGVLSKRG